MGTQIESVVRLIQDSVSGETFMKKVRAILDQFGSYSPRQMESVSSSLIILVALFVVN
jgi:hypothetical protein